MILHTQFDFNQKVFSKTYNRNVIVANVKITTYGNLINKNNAKYKECEELYEIKFRDPSIMRYEWVNRSDLELVNE